MLVTNCRLFAPCKLLFLALLTACLVSLQARKVEEVQKVKYPGGRTYLFRVTLKDKQGTPYSLSRPQEFLSEKAISRRKKQNIGVDSTDLPVNPAYINEINLTGVSVVSRSKWNNTVLVSTHNQGLMKKVEALGCVAAVRKVFTSPDSISELSERAKYHTNFNRWDTITQTAYGVTYDQVEMLRGVPLHKRGFTGRGKTIAVLDGGFMNADKIPCLQRANIVGWEDFVYPRSNSIFKEMEHGTKVLSVMAVNEPNTYMGTAPNAAYWLLRCEDTRTESMAEEDYWVAAAEFADSVGADIINSSLGFHDFDCHADDYTYAQIDGHTAFISRAASMLASKGIVLVNSAGNDGMGTWKAINVPADADDILTVGSISPNRRNTPFSSVGPTADGRIKPDVMALGSPTAVITGRGTIIMDIGTSFSAPQIAGLVACLWQALPDKTAKEIIELVRRSGDNYATPNNILGYGVPDFERAYAEGM